MSKATRCDKCGKYEDFHTFTIGGNYILSEVPRPYYYPDELDLCNDCGDELRGIIRKWWRKRVV